MSYKEKYEAVLEKAREMMNNECSSEQTKVICQELFPELRESEDEEIRKEIRTLYNDIDSCIDKLLKARTNKDTEAEGKALFRMEGLMVGTLQDLSCIEDYLEKQKERQHGGQVDPTDASWYAYYQRGLNKGYGLGLETGRKEQKPAEWSEEDEKMRQRLIASLGRIGANTRTDSTSVNYCFIEEIAWLKSLRPQPKVEWSEEDELNLQSCIAKIEIDMQRWGDNGKTMVDGDRKLIDWLNARRPQTKTTQTAEGQHNDQTIAWKKYEEGHRFDSDTLVIGLDRSEPRLVRCAVSACYGIAVKDLLNLPFCL